MINLDTNILVRYIARDDFQQTAAATDLIETRLSERDPGFVSMIALVEFCWVLERAYSAEATLIEAAVSELLESPVIELERSDLVVEALALSHRDFSDRLLHLAGLSAGATKTLTFDRRFARLDGVDLLT